MVDAVLESPTLLQEAGGAVPVETVAVRLRIKRDSVIGFSLMHLAAVGAFFTFSWPAFWVFFTLQWITGGLGICLCYHRLLAHRSFQIWKPLEYLLAVCGCLAYQNGPIKWVATHRLHHARSDQPNDPHSPTKGFWWAHMGWIFLFNDTFDVYKNYRAYAPDLDREAVYRFLNKTHGLYQVILGVILYAWGGWPFLFWGIFLRTVFMWHATWLVNSAAHIWGYQTWANGDRSTNNWWVALLTFGEGWHNNHHAFLRSAAHGLKRWELDLTYLTIRGLAALGLASNIHLPTSKEKDRAARSLAANAA